MLKCPFCSFANEDGAMFCEQCKSDLTSVAATPADVPMAVVEDDVPLAAIFVDDEVPLIEPATPVDDDVPVAGFVDDAPPWATAETVEAEPLMAEPMTEPVVLDQPISATEPMVPPELIPPPPPGVYNAAGESAVTAPPAVVEVSQELAAAAHALPPATKPAPPPAPAPAAPAAPLPAAPAPAAPAAGGTSVPVGSSPVLAVIRGQKVGVEFPLYGGDNYIGRADDKPVDVDLEDQEPPDRVWTSRQHAVIHYDDAAGKITLEDLNSSNGTFVNRGRVYPGQDRQLFVGDTVQIGTVHLKLKA